jgi:hypothetical protein
MTPLILLLDALPVSPTKSDLDAVVAALRGKCGTARYPLKSAAATLRQHRGSCSLSREAEQAIMARLRAELDVQRAVGRAASPAAATSPEYVDEVGAAALLGLSPVELRRLMVDPAQRRAHGWPLWNGSGFRYPLIALKAATRASFVAGLPAQEPFEDLLPEWCRRIAGAGGF